MPYTLAPADRYLKSETSEIESDTSDSVIFAYMPDNEPSKYVAEWTGKQFTKLFSAVYTGAKLMFPDISGEIIWQLLKVVHKPITLEDEDDDGCINYKPYAPFISYEPANPYNSPDLIPDGYINQPFHVNSDLAYPELLGYQATDVLVPIDAIPVFGDWGDVLGLHFPTIKLHVRGTGQIEVDFLSIVAGGQCIVKVGSAPNIIDIIDGIIETGVKIVDLGEDITSIPPESDTVIAEEINIDAPDGTDVYFTFVPKIDISTEFFGMGGGIRQIGLCGLETDGTMSGIEDIRIMPDPDNYPVFLFQKRVAGEWLNFDTDFEFSNGFLPSVKQEAHRANVMAEALRSVGLISEGWEVDSEYVGFEDSPLQEYIDAGDSASTFDPSSLESAIETLNTQVGVLDEDVEDLQDALETAEGNITTLQGDNTTQAGQITAIQAVNTTQSSNISNLQGRMTTAELDIDIAQADILAFATQIGDLESRVDGLDFGGVWAWIHDLTTSDCGYVASFGTYSSGVGWVATGSGLEIALEYQVEHIRQNQIDYIEIYANITGAGSTAEVRIGWLGSYLGAMEHIGSDFFRGWIRVPNGQFPVYPKVRIITDTGAITVKSIRYLGRGTVLPFD